MYDVMGENYQSMYSRAFRACFGRPRLRLLRFSTTAEHSSFDSNFSCSVQCIFVYFLAVGTLALKAMVSHWEKYDSMLQQPKWNDDCSRSSCWSPCSTDSEQYDISEPFQINWMHLRCLNRTRNSNIGFKFFGIKRTLIIIRYAVDYRLAR